MVVLKLGDVGGDNPIEEGGGSAVLQSVYGASRNDAAYEGAHGALPIGEIACYVESCSF